MAVSCGGIAENYRGVGHQALDPDLLRHLGGVHLRKQQFEGAVRTFGVAIDGAERSQAAARNQRVGRPEQMRARAPRAEHVALYLRHRRECQPRLSVVAVASQYFLQQRARLGEIMLALQDGGMHQQYRQRHRFARHPRCDHRSGAPDIARIAGAAAIFEIGARQGDRRRYSVGMPLQIGAQRIKCAHAWVRGRGQRLQDDIVACRRVRRLRPGHANACRKKSSDDEQWTQACRCAVHGAAVAQNVPRSVTRSWRGATG